ncbi:MAG: Rpp14/Pop5 family protein [Candidatus Nanoarchaeia archaeon]
MTINRKVKPLLPSLREKKRYLVFEVISNEEIREFSSIKEAIWQSNLALLGELGMGEAGLWMLEDKWQQEEQKGIMRVNNKYIDKLRVSLSLIKEAEQKQVIVRSVGISGTLKKAQEKFLAS